MDKLKYAAIASALIFIFIILIWSIISFFSYSNTLKELDTVKKLNLDFSTLRDEMQKDHPHAHMDVITLVRYYNYSVEKHVVKTANGYLIELHRITGNTPKSSPKGKQAVFLQHGLLCSSMDWVIMGPNKSIGFLLADAGYDVWMGNNRGNVYSRNHASMTVKDPEYWDFSWHEIGKNDLPSLIDYVIRKSGNKKIYYVGHSQGCTMFFVFLSENPQYNDKIKTMFALAPVAYASNIKSYFLRLLALQGNNIHLITHLIGANEFNPNNDLFRLLVSKVCSKDQPSILICSNILFLICGWNEEQLDLDLLPAILAHTPAGSSMKQFAHYAQLMNSGYFRQYDYGYVRNIINYGWFYPPEYKFSNVKVPVSVHYSLNDLLSVPADVKKMYSQLPNRIGMFLVQLKKFNHLDFIWAKDVKTLLNDKIINLISQH